MKRAAIQLEPTSKGEIGEYITSDIADYLGISPQKVNTFLQKEGLIKRLSKRRVCLCAEYQGMELMVPYRVQYVDNKGRSRERKELRWTPSGLDYILTRWKSKPTQEAPVQGELPLIFT